MPSHPWRNNCPRISALASRILPPTLLEIFNRITAQRHEAPPLNFPELPSRLPQLLELGLSQDDLNFLYNRIVVAVGKVDEILSEIYHTTAPQLCENTNPFIPRSTCIESFQRRLLLLRAEAIEKLWRTLLSQAQSFVREARPINESPSASCSTIPMSRNDAPSGKRKRQGRPASFTSEQTFVLNALLAHDDQYSSEDKELISQRLNLTRDQVNRWFCNARARKKGSRDLPLRGASLDSVRTVSSNLSTSELNLPTPGPSNATPKFTHPTPSTTTELTVSTPELHNRCHAFTNSIVEVDSLDVYLNYSACLEPESSSVDHTHHVTPQQDHITSWSENVNMTTPVVTTSSSLQSQPAPTSFPNDAPLVSHLQESHDQFFDPLDFSCIQPPSSAPESHLLNNLFPDFDLSHW